MTRTRWILQAVLAAIAAALAVLSAVWPEWIEEVFGIEPDGGNGSAEWIVVLVFAATAVAVGRLSYRSRQALRAASA